jgi:hypothetical protein
MPDILRLWKSEAVDSDLQVFYQRLLTAMNTESLRGGEWRLWERSGWPDNQTYPNLAAWCWHKEDNRYLVVVNLSRTSAQALVRISWDDVRGKSWQLADAFSAMRTSGMAMGCRSKGFTSTIQAGNTTSFNLNVDEGKSRWSRRLKNDKAKFYVKRGDIVGKALISVLRPAVVHGPGPWPMAA